MIGYQALANAVIAQAADDYGETVLLLRIDPTDTIGKNRMKELEDFFLSEWCRILTNTDPNYILERLRRENNK